MAALARTSTRQPRRRTGPARLSGLAALSALVLALAIPGTPALAQNPGTGAADPRCAEWENGTSPAGLDLSALCVAREVVGTYTAPGVEDDPLLPYVGAALIAGMGLALAGVLAMKVVGRPAARRLAPDAPLAWWVCASCQSVNAAGRLACYACRAPVPPDIAPADLMPTAASPSMDQRFGRPSG